MDGWNVQSKLNRRSFIRRALGAGISVGAASGLAGAVAARLCGRQRSKPLRLCMLSGSEEYKSNDIAGRVSDGR